MPTTPLRNAAYRLRLAIPVGIPRLERYPDMTVKGGPLHFQKSYVHLLRKHHVLGSAALLRSGLNRTVILSSSRRPEHIVTEQSLFRVASITKMATSLCALIAVDQGKLTLDDPITDIFRFLPECHSIPELRGITLRHLLSHTSGLRDPESLESALNENLPFPRILPGCAVTEPGKAFRYSNLGFGLVGSLLEAVYGEPVSEVFSRLLFRPLSMRATLSAAGLNPSEIVPITRVYRYHPGKDLIMTPLGSRPVHAPDPLRHYGYTAGAMYLDLPSLERLMDCVRLKGTPLLREALGSEMIRKQAEYGSISPTLSYGLGLLRISDPALSDSVILGHQGFAYGCADGAFWEENTGRMILFLNGGASEARRGRLGLCNFDLLRWALRKEFPQWSRSGK